MSDDRPMSDVRRVPSWIYTDPDVFQEEKQRIFATTWNLLGHESELREPGDFTVRYIADDSILIVRGEDGNLRGFHNVCRHRGMQVCRADLGNTKRFTCAYHGWLYDRAGRLVGVPLDKPHFGEQGINRDEHSLLPIARLDTCEGFIFGALSRDAGSLADYLGDFAWYMAIQSRRDPAGLEVIGEPQRWIVKGNWKSGAENAMGDSYHAQFTHRSVMEIGVHPNHLSDFQGRGSRNGIHVDTGRATIAFARQSPMERGYPPSMVEQFQANLPSAQRALIFDHGPVWPTRAAVFPNLMFLNAGAYIAAERLVPFFFCRVWRPLRADAIEVWNWVLVERGATEEFKQDSQRAFVLTFGPAGMEEQDDAENFAGVARMATGHRAREIDQVLAMNLDLAVGDRARESRVIADWPGPGTALSTTYTDAGNRRFARLWADAMRPWPGLRG